MFIEAIKEKFRPQEADPVQQFLTILKRRKSFDPFIQDLIGYLEMAVFFKAKGQHIVDSCIDLAESMTRDSFYVEIRNEKIRQWQANRDAALAIDRPPRVIRMGLFPLYFSLILNGQKPYEGRGYTPASRHRYQDIRQGDIMQFSVDTGYDTALDDARSFGIDPGMRMKTVVEHVLFAPNVHYMYQHLAEASDFQPTLSGPSELLQLERAGVYYQFDGYPNKIREHGFIGYHVAHPQLLTEGYDVNGGIP